MHHPGQRHTPLLHTRHQRGQPIPPGHITRRHQHPATPAVQPAPPPPAPPHPARAGPGTSTPKPAPELRPVRARCPAVRGCPASPVPPRHQHRPRPPRRSRIRRNHQHHRLPRPATSRIRQRLTSQPHIPAPHPRHTPARHQTRRPHHHYFFRPCSACPALPVPATWSRQDAAAAAAAAANGHRGGTTASSAAGMTAAGPIPPGTRPSTRSPAARPAHPRSGLDSINPATAPPSSCCAIARRLRATSVAVTAAARTATRTCSLASGRLPSGARHQGKPARPSLPAATAARLPAPVSCPAPRPGGQSPREHHPVPDRELGLLPGQRPAQRP